MRPLSALLFSCVCLCAYGEAPKVDNDVVRIVEVVHAARTPVSPLRYETNRVLVSLDAGNLQSTAADGHTSRRRWTAGQAAWVPAGESPASENVGSAPMRMIEIELK